MHFPMPVPCPCAPYLDSHTHDDLYHPATTRDQMAREGNTSPTLGPGLSSKTNIIQGHLHQQRLWKNFNHGSHAEVQPLQGSLLSVSSGSHTAAMLLLHSTISQHFLLFFQILHQSSPWWFKTFRSIYTAGFYHNKTKQITLSRAHLYTFFPLSATRQKLYLSTRKKKKKAKQKGWEWCSHTDTHSLL